MKIKVEGFSTTLTADNEEDEHDLESLVKMVKEHEDEKQRGAIRLLLDLFEAWEKGDLEETRRW